MIRLGYHNLVNVYEIDQLSYQLVTVADLEGHKSIVTAVTSIPKSSVIATGDDQGYVRLWDLAYMRCFQVVRLAREIRMLKCLDSWLIFGDKRVNMIALDIPKEDRSVGTGYFTKIYDNNFEVLYIFNHNSCLSISMENGCLQEIFILCRNEEAGRVIDW